MVQPLVMLAVPFQVVPLSVSVGLFWFADDVAAAVFAHVHAAALVCWKVVVYAPLEIVVLPVALPTEFHAELPPPDPHAAPESSMVVALAHSAQCPAVMAPVKAGMLAPAKLAAPVPPPAIPSTPHDAELPLFDSARPVVPPEIAGKFPLPQLPGCQAVPVHVKHWPLDGGIVVRSTCSALFVGSKIEVSTWSASVGVCVPLGPGEPSTLIAFAVALNTEGSTWFAPVCANRQQEAGNREQKRQNAVSRTQTAALRSDLWLLVSNF